MKHVLTLIHIADEINDYLEATIVESKQQLTRPLRIPEFFSCLFIDDNKERRDYWKACLHISQDLYTIYHICLIANSPIPR